MTGIRLRGVSKLYQLEPHTKTVLAEIDLDIKQGEFICLLGPSGCGKTTLLNIMSGLDKNYLGELEVGTPGQKVKMSYVFQESRLLPWLSVWDNLAFVLDKPHAPETRVKIAKWLARIGLKGYEAYFPGQLSIGMQQRVSVARALILEPSYLFMDEPFSSLDELTASKMRHELLELWQEQGCTVVFVTHNPLEAVFLADRVLIMSASPGRIVKAMNIANDLPRPRNPEDPKLWELSRLAVRQLSQS
ncbi:MAG: ABC transporter ATP-binding protein [Deinococcales bacterium]